MLAFVSGVLMAALFFGTTHQYGIIPPLSFASAYVSLLFLCITLLIGPWNVLRRRSNPVSTDLRRDVGIWAAILGLIHVVAGFQVHMGGKFWLYFLWPPDSPHRIPLRYDLFGFANFTGLGATLLLLLLLVLSNDLSLRALGGRRWKALQRWNYVNFALVIAHSVAYMLGGREPVYVVAFSGMIVGVVTVQWVGIRKILSRSGTAAANPEA
jgi:sulfoxide reductase heme-binding subunit YedZ